MIKHWRQENGKSLLTGVISTKNTKKTWVVADYPSINYSLKCNIKENVNINKYPTQKMINREFTRLVANSLQLPYYVVETIISMEPLKILQ